MFHQKYVYIKLSSGAIRVVFAEGALTADISDVRTLSEQGSWFLNRFYVNVKVYKKITDAFGISIRYIGVFV